MRIQHIVITTSALLGVLPGCAASNASYAIHQKQATLRVNTLSSSAQRLVTDTVSNPRFKRFKSKNQGEESYDVVVRLGKIDNRAEGVSPTAYQRELLDWLEQYFADNGVVFQGDRAALEKADLEDSDDFYDQSTGSVTTGAKEKSVLLMDLVVFSQEVEGGTKEWTLRAKFQERGRGVTLMSASSVPKADDR
jgi:hypothetical protein